MGVAPSVQTLTILVGHRLAGADVLAAALPAARAHLVDAGVVVGPGPVSRGKLDLVEVTSAWADWLADQPSRSGSVDGVLPEPSLLDPLLIHDEAPRLVAALSAARTVRAVAFVRTVDDHVAASYLAQLARGRTEPYGTQERQGLGRFYNYFGRLDKWAAAVGPDQFLVRFCPPSAELSVLAADLDQILTGGDTGLAHLVHGRTELALSASAAETLRRFNVAIHAIECTARERRKARSTAVELLVERSQNQPRFAVPPADAHALRSRFGSLIRDNASRMPGHEATAYQDPGDPPNRHTRPREVERLLDEVAERLQIPGLVEAVSVATRTDQERAEQRARLRKLAGRVRSSRPGDKHEQLADEMRSVMAKAPDFRLRTSSDAGGEVRPIPDRVVQYWEPLPPPAEMEPWLKSWSSVGMPTGEHLLLTFDTGIPVMREAAGEDGVRAFEAAPHPAARADLLRYAELYLRGGWYVDAEHEALLPITDVLTWPVAHVLVRRPRGGEFQNQFIGAVPGSALLHDVLTQACANVLGGSDMTILQMTGPTMYTAVVEEYLTRSDASYVVLPTNVVLAGVLQQVHNDAEYKLRGHWRDQIIGKLD